MSDRQNPGNGRLDGRVPVRILLVEDDTAVIDFLCRVARREGYTDVDTASTGESALAKVVRNEYDLITVDIKLPGLSGLEILSILRNMCPHAVIAVISGHISPEMCDEVAGCADVLVAKPVSVEDFSGMLKGVAQIRAALNEIQLLGAVPSTSRKGAG